MARWIHVERLAVGGWCVWWQGRERDSKEWGEVQHGSRRMAAKRAVDQIDDPVPFGECAALYQGIAATARRMARISRGYEWERQRFIETAKEALARARQYSEGMVLP